MTNSTAKKMLASKSIDVLAQKVGTFQVTSFFYKPESTSFKRTYMLTTSYRDAKKKKKLPVQESSYYNQPL